MKRGPKWIAGQRQRVALLALISLVLAAVAAPVAAQGSPAAPGSGTWQAQNSGTTLDLSDVSCVDALHCWAVGEQGTILATVDGGQTWTAQPSNTSYPLLAVSFVDATHGWVLGARMDSPYAGAWGAIVLSTTDGGKTWTEHFGGQYQEQLQFVDETHGWMSGWLMGQIVATADGGKTWTVQYSGATTRAFPLHLYFVDPSHGWAIVQEESAVPSQPGEAGILATTDGGRTWTRTAAEFPLSLGPDNKAALSFVDPTHGWAVGQGGTILATADGGQTWTAQPVPPGEFRFLDVVFLDRSQGWVLGHSWVRGYGEIFRTDDGGRTWTRYRPQTPGDLTAIAFPDANHGWGVGEGGTILAYTGPGIAPAGTTPGQRGVRVVLNGRELPFDVPPVIESGRTLVPFRAIMEALGMAIGWDPATRKVTGQRGDLTIELTIGSTTANRNGQPVSLDVPAQIVDGRTLVPLRFISEQSGAQVSWDGQQQLATITWGK